jgi:hypothetical protein
VSAILIYNFQEMAGDAGVRHGSPLRLLSLVAALAVCGAPGVQAAPHTDTEKLAALARLYGVVRWFHPSDAAQEVDWNRFAVHAVGRIRVARVDELDRALEALFAPVAVGLVIDRDLPAAVPGALAGDGPVAWRHWGLGAGSAELPSGIARGAVRPIYASARTNRPSDASRNFKGCEGPRTAAHVDVDLGRGLRGRVPLVLGDAEARVGAGQRRLLAALQAELAALPSGPETHRDVRAADVLVAWSAFRHFYPYWADLDVDWDARLPLLLEAASRPKSRDAHRDALRRLIGHVRDGHGWLADPQESRPKAGLPIAVRWLGGRLLVTASAVPDQVHAGDVIVAIDGRTTKGWIAGQKALASGSPQWLAVKAAAALIRGPQGSRVVLTLQRPSGTADVTLTRSLREQVREARPEPVAELRPGTWYVDLERAGWSVLQPRLPELAGAQALVFDMRGYPGDAGLKLLRHLLEAPEKARWMHVPCVLEPFGRVAAWESVGWNLAPASPRLTGETVFLTDARAISYAESVMGYVDALGLGTVVGGATAGTNGNVNAFQVPSGMTLMFTGMRVTRHDGSPFHLVGVLPRIPVEPTAAGIRAGRDEVLDRALAHLAARQSAKTASPR